MIYIYVDIFLRSTVGLVFLLSGVSKGLHPERFRQALMNYRLGKQLAGRPSRIVAALVPALEVVTGVLLIVDLVSALIGEVIALCLLLAFTALVFDNARHGIDADCGCGVAGGRTGYALVWRNVVLGFVLIGALIAGGGSTILHHHLEATALVPVYAEAVLAAAACLYVPVIFQEIRHQLGHVA